MNFVYILHVMIFALSAVLVLASVPRARRISHQRTREGMVVFLLSVGVWSVGYVGYLVLPGRSLKLAFYLVGFVFALVAVAAWVYFSAAYTGRPPRMAPFKRTAVGVFLALLGLKVTNPIHNLYFTSEWASEPFPHLAIQHGIFYWLVLGVSYAVIAVAFWMLIERFYHAGTDTRPLVGLIGLTAVPALATIFGSSIPGMLPLMYEPPGVALFAVGTLFVYFQKFEEIRYAADTDDPTIYLGQNGQIREANAAAIELFPKLADGVQKFLGEVLPEVASQMSEEGVIRRERDGEENFLEVSVNPIKAGDTTTGRLITIRDVTDRERYRRDLEERTEQLELLNRVVRHDIRNDMFVIQGWSETLEEHVDRDGTDALERIQTTSKQIIDLTETARDLLDLVTSQSTPELEPIDLAEQLDIELSTAKSSYSEADIQLEGELPTIAVGATPMLRSVFRNLLNNAIQHNDKEAPVVEFTVAEQEETVEVRVRDNGPGIPEDQRERLFEKGQTGPDSQGTGMGLYLVSTLVDLYGGDLRVEDAEPEGSVFTVELQKWQP